MSVMAAIVSYNPDLARLQESLTALQGQVDAIVIIDNGSTNLAEVTRLTEQTPDCHLVANGANRGVAAALNQAFAFAEERAVQWLLTLDQDSVCGKEMVTRMLAQAGASDIGILCPKVADRNGPAEDGPTVAVAEVTSAITSGSLTRVRAWRAVDGFDEWLFIDYVDHDFSWRLRAAGWRLLRVGSAVLTHELGALEVRSVFGRQVLVYHHAPKRKYFYVRNGAYLAWVHRSSQGIGRPLLVLLKRVVVTVAFERDRLQKTGWMLRGVWDAAAHIRHQRAATTEGTR